MHPGWPGMRTIQRRPPAMSRAWGIAAVGSRHHVATGAGGTAGAAMTAGTAIAETCTQREIGVDVAEAIVGERSLSLTAQKLALEQLSAATNSAKRITRDDE